MQSPSWRPAVQLCVAALVLYGLGARAEADGRWSGQVADQSRRRMAHRGASLAAAQTSGIVALLRARNSRLRSAEALALLEQSHAVRGSSSCLVNACSALAQMLEGGACANGSGGRALARVQDR